MPEFEDLEGRSSTQDSETEGNGKSADKTSRITVPVAPHRGQTIEYSPRRRGTQGSRFRSRAHLKNSEGDEGRGARIRRTRKIDSAYTRRTLPESLANLPEPVKGPGLLARFKALLTSLYKSLQTDPKRQPKKGKRRRRRRPRSQRQRRNRSPVSANRAQSQERQTQGSRRKPLRRRRSTDRHRNQSGTKAFEGGTDSDAPKTFAKPSTSGRRRKRKNRRRRRRSGPSS